MKIYSFFSLIIYLGMVTAKNRKLNTYGIEELSLNLTQSLEADSKIFDTSFDTKQRVIRRDTKG